MLTAQSLVERFYADVWDRADESAAWDILSGDLTFRGSLGSVRHGVEGFLGYMRDVHTALADYTCEIADLIATNDRVAAQMSFQGWHRATFLGYPPTHRMVRWAGAAFFTIQHEQITDIWVLGDLDSLKQQLRDTAGDV